METFAPHLPWIGVAAVLPFLYRLVRLILMQTLCRKAMQMGYDEIEWQEGVRAPGKLRFKRTHPPNDSLAEEVRDELAEMRRRRIGGS